MHRPWDKKGHPLTTTTLTFLTGKGRHRAWLARVTGKDATYGLAREFLDGTEFYNNGPKVRFDVRLVEGRVYQDHTKDFYVVRDGALVEVSRHNEAEVSAILGAPALAQAPAQADRQVSEAPAGSGAATAPFFIALPASRDERAPQGIYGIGRTAEAALADAYAGSQTRAPSVSQDDEGEWVVSYKGTYEAFPTEAEAQGYACELGFRAETCTEALYRRVEAEGYSDSGRNSYHFEAHGCVYEFVDLDAA
ncbi:hypothetical protein LPLAFNJD_LOCUS2752 [Methylorubrum aminovorans]